MIVMSEEEYLFSKGVGFSTSGFCLDKLVLPHGETSRQRKKRLKQCELVEANYQKKRTEAREEYRRLVMKQEIVPKTHLELTYEKAVHGHPDNFSTLAARRLLDKRGFYMVYAN